MTTEVLTPAPSAQPPTALHRRRRRRRRGPVVVLVLLVACGLGLAQWLSHPDDVRDGTDLVSTAQLAARQGVDVDLIAVTAANGLVEFRYQVVDPDKATRILHDPELAPILVDEASGATLQMSAPPHKHGGELRLGGTYFFLMANSHNVLHQGSKVTLVMGDTRVEHLTVQG